MSDNNGKKKIFDVTEETEQQEEKEDKVHDAKSTEENKMPASHIKIGS